MTLCPLSPAGSKAAAEYTNGLFELGSPGSAGPLQVLQLVEDLRLALELQPREEERNTLRAQVPSSTAQMLMDWLDMDRGSDRGSVNLRSPVNNESYQERLVRLEGDKESLVLQVSVLTDQVEAQGEKIRDLESSLEEHHHKLNSTEEMLQQELLSRNSLETQKLDLMDEVSYLKLKLVGMDEKQNHNDSSKDQQNKAEVQYYSAGWHDWRESHTGLVNRKSERLDESTQSDLSPLSSGVDSGKQSPVSPENKKNHLGIKKLWGKIRRTQSGTLQREDLEPGEFKRGGLRATASPRLARTGETLTSVWDLKTPFSKWTPEQVCCWLEESGLDQYVILAQHWANSGQTLLSATPQDLEKEMGIKNPLHRKKLQLALKSFSTKTTEKSSELDHIWVTRWLDDIGLPQYKGQFHEGRVDGRMIQYLTVNDLLFLKVTSQLHHLSVKCAIHVLHVNKFNPNCLKRRPGDEVRRVCTFIGGFLFTQYIQLKSEILEPRFNSDTLAMLLNIPPQKTLLRRHLATNFNMLVGSQAQQEKREFMESLGYAPLSTTAKVRPKKLGFSNFGHLRKKRCDESTDYICPLEAAQVQAVLNGAHRPYSGFRGLSPILDRDPDRRQQVGPNTLSKSINKNTSVISVLFFLINYIQSLYKVCFSH
uniref:SAM domain-containing protein n=1 Tax=Oncorhynchus tshawytscha TaxID=74940 RepID=A0A8C8IGM7_ONCTS